jgi:hypothetical protein
MFTTGVHAWLYAATGFYAIAWGLAVFHQRRPAAAALAVGFILQSLYLIGRGWLGGVFVIHTVVEGLFLLPWCLALIALVRSFAFPKAPMGGLLGLVTAFSLFCVFYSKGMIPPSPKHESIWATLFFLSESMAHALFYAAAWMAVLSLAGKAPPNMYYTWLVWGFSLYTVAQMTGALWCFVGWGNTFSWGSRHLSSAAIWTFFAATLHLQFVPKWKPKSALLAVAGGLLVLYISYGNYPHEMRHLRVGG